MLVLYINEHSIKKSNRHQIIMYDGKQVINPRDEDFIKAGYKELIEDEIPEYNQETHYLSINYEDTENAVLMHYTVNEIPEETNEEDI